jgi:hypothetical protein
VLEAARVLVAFYSHIVSFECILRCTSTYLRHADCPRDETETNQVVVNYRRRNAVTSEEVEGLRLKVRKASRRPRL